MTWQSFLGSCFRSRFQNKPTYPSQFQFQRNKHTKTNRMISTTTTAKNALLRTRLPAMTIRSMSTSTSTPTLPYSPYTMRKEEGYKSNKQQKKLQSTASDVTSEMVPTKTTSPIVLRFTSMAEVTVSKIFPAGFGWQTAATYAEAVGGFAPDSLHFALCTGVGDMMGVWGGHVLYSALKQVATESGDFSKEIQTGALLGSAAFCSGTVWQPVVNMLQGMELPFVGVMAGTWVACGAAFYGGLRIVRSALGGSTGVLTKIDSATGDNAADDALLSTSIGGATGFFVGTDMTYLPAENVLMPLVGISDSATVVQGAALAGASTSLGFVTAQSAMNLTVPAGKSWND